MRVGEAGLGIWNKKGPGGGYWYYWSPIAALALFVIAAVITDGFGTGAI